MIAATRGSINRFKKAG